MLPLEKGVKNRLSLQTGGRIRKGSKMGFPTVLDSEAGRAHMTFPQISQLPGNAPQHYKYRNCLPSVFKNEENELYLELDIKLQ